MFISKEVETLSSQYIDNPFGDKKDKRIQGWLEILKELPKTPHLKIDLYDQVSSEFYCNDDTLLEELLLKLLPWRKGPFKVNKTFIDSEWDSDKKWRRFRDLNLDLKGKSVLDVGSGNGYYAFRMLGLGADKILCLEPNLVHISQFAAINHFIGSKKIRMIPERLENSGLIKTRFDLIFSMGLLYHQRQPKDHLSALKALLRKEGRLIIETIISPKEFETGLEPKEGKYASMPNVHYLHTDHGCKSLFRELDLKLIDETKPVKTSDQEQRKTQWMPFKSFESALDKEDKSLTIEGYPAPKRKFYILELSS